MCDQVSPVTPVKKNKRGKVIRSKQKRLVISLYKTKKANKPSILYKQLIQELMTETGIGRNSIEKIISEYNGNKTISSPIMKKNRPKIIEVIDDFYKNAIRQKVHSFWQNRDPPTLDKIVNSVSEDDSLPTLKRTTMYNLLKDLNFIYTKRKQNSVLSEREDLIVCRRNYLRSIKAYREEGRTLYYLGETMVSEKLIDDSIKSNINAFRKESTTDASNPTDKSKYFIIIVHIGSREGFVDGGLTFFNSNTYSNDYDSEINGENFLKWFNNILPLLNDNAVIIMDNAPYYSVKAEQIPVSSWKKANIMKWLQEKNVHVDTSYVKAELLDLVQKHKLAFDKYVVDEVAKANNKIVLRLPPYHFELNLIEQAWSMVKEYIKDKNTTIKFNNVKKLLIEAVESVTAENWRNFEDHIIEEETKFWEIDNIVDDFIDDEYTCTFNVRTSSDDSDDSM